MILASQDRKAMSGAWEAVMAVVVTAAAGYDLGYVWKNQPGREVPERSAGGYYINAAQAGEPPGLWLGPGAAALGFAEGQLVERGPYEQVYRQVDPRSGEKLGRSRGRYASFADHLARLTAAEPHATSERLVELERLAAQATRQPAAYTDMTVSFSKSISVFHASIRENERRARLAGDQASAAWWAEAEARYREVLQAANRAGLAYAQRHAGITRTGYHGARVNGQEPGRFEEGLLVVSSWLQGTSRDGDPQDHIHNQIARMVKTSSDGNWRALDTVSLRGVLGAVQAVVAAHAECGLTGAFGVEWVPRADRAGNEIAGISQEQMDAYSARTVTITASMPDAVASWTAKFGREPNQRELLHIRQAVTMATRHGKEDGVIDWDAVTASWDARLGGQLASVAPRVSNLRAPAPNGASGSRAGRAAQPAAQPRAEPATQGRGEPAAQACAGPGARSGAASLRSVERTRAVQGALALVQSAHSTWTRADLIKQLGRVLPASTRAMAPEAAVALLDRLADEAVSGSAGQVACLEAPQWPPLPPSLLRESDGRSVYTRPGSTRYATGVQLSLEEQLLADAGHQGAPRLGHVQAAMLLGVGAAALEDALAGHAGGRSAASVAGGLRLDQAAALYYALTAAQTAVVLTGPAGAGKTRVLAEAARLWAKTGKGPVAGIATAQAARNVLTGAGVAVAENSSVFLGHLPGQRGALGIRDISPGTLLLIDEASMMSMPDLADIIACAARNGAKVIVAGDQEQLAPVESGGGMQLLASRIGYVQLTEAVRFTQQWERDASLRLRAGDPSALDEYMEHGRVSGAAPEQALDQAARAYVARYLDGDDVLLMIADRDRCWELSRRVRDDLVHLGLVDGTGRQAQLAHGAVASAGDLIIARANDHDLEAGEPGRTLANGDTLQVKEVRRDGTLLVRRAVDCDPVTGRRRWTRPFAWSGYQDADLGYAVTGHSAQGRTVTAGIAVVTGTEDRRWLYVAMTRGRARNAAIVFTRPGTVPDPREGTRPAPELARHHRVQVERAGLPAPPTLPGAPAPEPRHAIAVAADTLAREGAETSATQTRDQALADADHLAVLNAIWQDQTTRLHRTLYQQIVTAALAPHDAAGGLDTPTAAWLWRTLRAAETAGLDPAQVTRHAIQSRTLTGARDIAAVVDFRIRQITDPLLPLPPRAWSQRVPDTPDPELRRYLTQLAEMMDARKDRIGEHLASYPEPWTLQALGPVPADPLARLGWQHRAADIGAYRELYGYHHPDDPIGPEPTADSPDKRADWRAAFAALGPAATDTRALPDGALWHARAAYQAVTAWAPRHTGRELARIRASAEDAHLAAIRAHAEETVARHRRLYDVAARHAALARSFIAMTSFYRACETELDHTMTLRRQWEHATRHTRQLAINADTELRRRHPHQQIEPLCTADPTLTEAPSDQLDQDPGTRRYQTPNWISTLAAERRAVSQRLDQRAELLWHSAGLRHETGTAWPRAASNAILRPLQPQIQPSDTIKQAERQAEAK
jgi:hypothetical protein